MKIINKMTPKNFIESKGFTTEEPFSYFNQQWLDWMKEYARLMCDKQKEICLKRTGLIPIKGIIDTYLDVDRDCINNSPYPEELQS